MSLALLLLCLPHSLSQSITQSPPALTLRPGDKVELSCRVLGAGDPYMYWYRQSQGGGTFGFIASSVAAGSVEELTLSHFSAKRSSKENFSLNSDGVFLNDSGIYFCAWSHTVGLGLGGPDKKPQIQKT
ncbi:hypothetical protein XELAEV_18034160mg, partial [Xenopus laevis]